MQETKRIESWSPQARPKWRARGLVLVLVTLGVPGCYPKSGAAPGPLSAATAASASTRWPGATAESLSAGRDLFLAKCNGCHDYPDLTAIADERWPNILDKMGKKAHLAPVEKDEVLHYVLAWRSEKPAPAAAGN